MQKQFLFLDLFQSELYLLSTRLMSHAAKNRCFGRVSVQLPEPTTCKATSLWRSAS